MSDTANPPEEGKVESLIDELQAKIERLVAINKMLTSSLSETLSFNTYLIQDVDFEEVQRRFDYRGNRFLGYKSRAEKAIKAARDFTIQPLPGTGQSRCAQCDREIDKSTSDWHVRESRPGQPAMFFCNDLCQASYSPPTEIHVDL